MATAAEEALLTGLLVGEGHFGGDGRQPQVTLRMHVRHERLFRWITRTFPGGRLYGPYHHGGRDYFQWMARGAFLRNELLPILDRFLTPELDDYTYGRFRQMCDRYSLAASSFPEEEPPASNAGSGEAPPSSAAIPAPTPGAARSDVGLDAIFAQLRGDAP